MYVVTQRVHIRNVGNMEHFKKRIYDTLSVVCLDNMF